MRNFISRNWARAFGRRSCRKLNSFLLRLAIRGLGVMNYENDSLSGEAWLITKFLRKKIGNIEKPVLFDVGANEGNYAASLCSTFPNGTVYCFEPHPKTFQKLLETTNHLAVEPVNIALGESCGSRQLFDYAGENGGSQHATVVPQVLQKLHGGEATAIEVVETTIDKFCEENEIDRINFLKIDVEGNEYSCLCGAKKMLASCRIGIIQFEFNQMNIHSKVFMEDFFAILEGYHLYRLLPSGLLPLNRLDTLQTNLFVFQNIIAIPASSKEWP